MRNPGGDGQDGLFVGLLSPDSGQSPLRIRPGYNAVILPSSTFSAEGRTHPFLFFLLLRVNRRISEV